MNLKHLSAMQALGRLEARTAALPPPDRAAGLLDLMPAFAAAAEVADVTGPAKALRRAVESRNAEDVAQWAAWSHRRGGTLVETLARLPAGSPHEPSLHLTTLRRIEVAAALRWDDPQGIAAAADQALALISAEAPAALLGRVSAALLSLALIVPPGSALRVRIFSEAAARLFSAAAAAARELGGEVPVDQLISTVFAGGDVTLLPEQRAAPHLRLADEMAYLTGALAASEPSWWPEIRAQVQHQGGDDFPPLPALLSGLGEGAVGAQAQGLRDALLHAAASLRPTVRQGALVALCRRRDDDPRTRTALSAVSRDPNEGVRTAIAAALMQVVATAGGDEGAWAVGLLCRLADDPCPAVRAAAAVSLLAADDVPRAVRELIASDLATGTLAVRYGAALGAACLGSSDEAIAPLLVQGIVEVDDPSGPEWQGLSRFRTAAWPLAVWAGDEQAGWLLHERAAEDDRWLCALGSAMHSGFAGLRPVPEALRERLLLRAYKGLGADEERFRLAAATVLGRCADGDRRVLDPLLDQDFRSLRLLRVLAVLSAELHVSAPALLPPLFACLREGQDGDEDAEERARLAIRSISELAPPGDAQAEAELLTCLSAAPLRDSAYDGLLRLLARHPEP